jgi:hypothetical protein
MIQRTYIIQSSEYTYGRWESWSCCSPLYQTSQEARRQYSETTETRYIHERIRLMRVDAEYEKIPGVRCHYLARTRHRVYATKRLKCVCPPTRVDLCPEKGSV